MTNLGKYELHEQIGRGGFGAVYRATDASLDREVALKVLHPQLMVDENFITRFKREARTLASLDNHHIVTVYEMGEESGRIYIAMRYLAGGSLKTLIKKKGPLPFEQVLSIIKQVVDGLADAHGKDLVHRDLKPENILFDAHQEAVITDFGLVKSTSSHTPGSIENILGTPNYIAPEIWSGKKATTQADIYALGCIVFEMLTGKVLFSGDSLPGVMKKHFDAPVFPERWPAGVPSGMGDFLRKALAADPGERFQDVDDFLLQLTRVAEKDASLASEPKKDQESVPKSDSADEPPDISPGNPPIPDKPDGRKRKILIGAGIAVIAVTAIGLALFAGNVFPYPPVSAPIQSPTNTQPPTRPINTATAPAPTMTTRPSITPTAEPTDVPVLAMLFKDNFEDGDPETSGWNPSVGTWTLEEENGNHFYRGTGPADYPQAWYSNDNTAEWTDYAFESRIRIRKGGVFLCMEAEGGKAFYNTFVDAQNDYVIFADYTGGKYETFGGISAPININEWYLMRFEVKDKTLKFFLNNRLTAMADRNTAHQGGIGYYMGGGNEVDIDDVRVWKLSE